MKLQKLGHNGYRKTDTPQPPPGLDAGERSGPTFDVEPILHYCSDNFELTPQYFSSNLSEVKSGITEVYYIASLNVTQIFTSNRGAGHQEMFRVF